MLRAIREGIQRSTLDPATVIAKGLVVHMIYLTPSSASSEVISLLDKFRLSAIYVATPGSADRPCIVGGAVDLSRSVGAIARKWASIFAADPVTMRAAWWAERPAVARLQEVVIHQLGTVYRGGGLIAAPLLEVEST